MNGLWAVGTLVSENTEIRNHSELLTVGNVFISVSKDFGQVLADNKWDFELIY